MGKKSISLSSSRGDNASSEKIWVIKRATFAHQGLTSSNMAHRVRREVLLLTEQSK